MEETKSINSSSKQSSNPSQNSKKKADSKDLKREKTLRKVLKEALQKEQDKVKTLEKDLEKYKSKAAILEKENKEKELKYLDLYMENNQQHEQIQMLQNQLQSNPFMFEKETSSIVDAVYKNGGSTNTNGSKEQEVVMQYEKKISELTMTIQKQERDISYKDEEVRSIKGIAREMAEKLEPVKEREDQIKSSFLEMEALIKHKDQEMHTLQNQMSDLRSQITDLKQQITTLNNESLSTVDQSLEFEGRLDKKNEEISALKEKILKLKDDIKGKDAAITALSDTLMIKGEENEKLFTKLTEFKNHHLTNFILGSKYLVQKIGTIKNVDMIFRFISDKSREEEYFLEINDRKGKNIKLIPAIDIEAIEPVQRTTFVLQYFVTGTFFGTSETLKEEHYQSKYLAQIKDSYERILEMIEKEEKESIKYQPRTQSVIGKNPFLEKKINKSQPAVVKRKIKPEIKEESDEEDDDDYDDSSDEDDDNSSDDDHRHKGFQVIKKK